MNAAPRDDEAFADDPDGAPPEEAVAPAPAEAPEEDPAAEDSQSEETNEWASDEAESDEADEGYDDEYEYEPDEDEADEYAQADDDEGEPGESDEEEAEPDAMDSDEDQGEDIHEAEPETTLAEETAAEDAEFEETAEEETAVDVPLEDASEAGQADPVPAVERAATLARILPAGQTIDLFPEPQRAVLGDAVAVVADALREQLPSLLAEPVANAELPNELVRQLTQHTFGGSAVLTPAADLAVEWAITAARVHGAGHKYKIITFVGDDHGRTLAGLAAGGDPQRQSGLGPLVAGFSHCPLGNAAAVAEAIDEETTAILLQPLQLGDGLRAADQAFLVRLRQLADEHGLLLIFDESQLPIGLSGRFSYALDEHTQPDMLVLGQGLAAGLPLGAVVLSAALASSLPPHPALATPPLSVAAAAAALATLQCLDQQDLLAQAAMTGEAWGEDLAKLEADFEFVRHSRGRGLLRSLELDVSAEQLQAILAEQGIRVGTAGSHTLRMQPPLDVGAAALQQSVEIFHTLFQTIEREPALG